METTIKKWLFYFAFVIMFLPMAEQKLHFIESKPLKGGFKPAADISFSLSGWLDGSYQQQKEKFLNDSTGFRADLVRQNNQIDYTLFDKCHSSWTVKGKDGYLFQFPYINGYYGTDYLGYGEIVRKSVMMKALQDTLAKLGKTFILVYAPSKAAAFPQYFPDDRKEPQVGTSNSLAFWHKADSLGINQIDMNAWFLAEMGKSKAPLFSKQGIHWSSYGVTVAGDSLIRYMERLRNVRVPHPDWSEVEHTSKLRGGDDDVAAELNLIFPVATETMAYPIVKNAPDSNAKKINAVYIGDSYGFKLVEFGIVHKMNDQCEYWYYFDEVHDINGHKFCYIRDYDWVGAMMKADCVVLVYTLYNFNQLGNSFIEKAYQHFYPPKV